MTLRSPPVAFPLLVAAILGTAITSRALRSETFVRRADASRGDDALSTMLYARAAAESRSPASFADERGHAILRALADDARKNADETSARTFAHAEQAAVRSTATTARWGRDALGAPGGAVLGTLALLLVAWLASASRLVLGGSASARDDVNADHGHGPCR